jgi:hypothetical protein
MDFSFVAEYVKKRPSNSKGFEFSVAEITTQVGHVWYVQDVKEKYNFIEEFIAEAFFCNPFESYLVTESSWSDRVDIPTWLLSLNITVVDSIVIYKILKNAIKDYQKSENYNVDNYLKLNSIDSPKNCWEIVETIDKRNPMGLTETYVFESDNLYHLIELHMES